MGYSRRGYIAGCRRIAALLLDRCTSYKLDRRHWGWRDRVLAHRYRERYHPLRVRGGGLSHSSACLWRWHLLEHRFYYLRWPRSYHLTVLAFGVFSWSGHPPRSDR